MPPKKTPSSAPLNASGDRNISIGGDVVDSVVISGDNNTVNQTVIQRITNFFTGSTEQQRAMRDRAAMLELVKNIWIKGVLEKSLYNEVLIQLGLEERPTAVDHPWDMQIQMPHQANRILPSGTSMMEVFDEMNGAMLILGEPGSGKTTMLLELARDCIDRAQEDHSRSIPVIFNLSSWDGKQIIDDWLTNELNTKYNVAQKTARSWVENDDLQLLLDGLDEVKLENREACVKAINDFRQKHGLTMPVAVCSRNADYEVLTAKLNLLGAVRLQPLMPKQIDEYFKQAGSELEGVYQTLKNDETLQELVKQPLMLSILVLGYQDRSTEVFAGENSAGIETRRKHLFDAYIQQMFRRVARTKNGLYTPQQTKYWLEWLAYEMIDKKQSIFLLEQIRRNWVYTRSSRLGQWIIANLDLDPLVKLLERPTEALKWSWRNTRALGIIGFIIAVSIFFVPHKMPDVAFLSVLSFAAVSGWVFLGITRTELNTRSSPNQAINQSWKNAKIFGLIFGLLACFTCGLTFSVLPYGSLGVLFGGGLGAIFGGICMGLAMGGFAVLNHYFLRFVLYCKGNAPWDYVSFLDHCADLIFLRRVGGGYIFVHRLLMEHFAAMYQEGEK